MAYGAFGKETELLVQDSAAMAAEGERVSFAQLQARASAVGQVLIGFFDVPKSVEQPLQLVINPEASPSSLLLCVLGILNERELYHAACLQELDVCGIGFGSLLVNTVFICWRRSLHGMVASMCCVAA